MKNTETKYVIATLDSVGDIIGYISDHPKAEFGAWDRDFKKAMTFISLEEANRHDYGVNVYFRTKVVEISASNILIEPTFAEVANAFLSVTLLMESEARICEVTKCGPEEATKLLELRNMLLRLKNADLLD